MKNVTKITLFALSYGSALDYDFLLTTTTEDLSTTPWKASLANVEQPEIKHIHFLQKWLLVTHGSKPIPLASQPGVRDYKRRRPRRQPAVLHTWWACKIRSPLTAGTCSTGKVKHAGAASLRAE
jgi:hypothetical protein